MAHKSFLFFSALVNSIINGANLMQTAKNTFTGGFWGGVSGFANFEIGNLGNVYMKITAHSVSEGAMEGIRGGHFEHGFFTGMASAAGGSLLNQKNYVTTLEDIFLRLHLMLRMDVLLDLAMR